MSSSLLTNTSAMTALQTLRSINNNLDATQDRVSTGLRINKAADNTAYWAISSIMKHDSGMINAVVDNINLGKSQIDTASTAIDSTKDALNDIQKSMVSTHEKSDSDINKIKDNIEGNLKNIENAIQSASLGEKNILSNGGQKLKIAASYRREGAQVYVDLIEVGGSDLNFGTMKNGHIDMKEGILKGIFGESTGKAAELIKDFKSAKGAYDDLVKKYEAAKKQYDHNPSDDTAKTSMEQAKKDMEDSASATGGADGKEGGAWYQAQKALVTTLNSLATDSTKSIDGLSLRDFLDLTNIGGLAADAQNALIGAIENTVKDSLQAVLAAGASLGSVTNQIKNQLNFVNALKDNIDKSVGALVDADMNAESARLSALQVQQQLAIQSLSIANQSTQGILALFRH